MIRRFLALPLALMVGCSPTIYVRDGVTDGDTFYLAPQAFTSGDPVVASWVAYGLMRSACQLEVGGEIPSRVSTFDCELTARQKLLDTWLTRREGGATSDATYLDTLARVREAGFLDEYVVHYFGKPSWEVPDELDLPAFGDYRRAQLRGHRPQTRWIGSWGYAGVASSIAAVAVLDPTVMRYSLS